MKRFACKRAAAWRSAWARCCRGQYWGTSFFPVAMFRLFAGPGESDLPGVLGPGCGASPTLWP
eukprot:7453870-Prorocentrum_lima.AAC.1